MRKRPSHILYITDRDNAKHKTKAGAIFENDAGGLNLVLNPGVVLTSELMEKNWLTFWPYDPERSQAYFDAQRGTSLAPEGTQQEAAPSSGNSNADDDDDIPF